MLSGLFQRGPRARRFIYIPQTYNPDEELPRDERLNFKRYMNKRRRASRSFGNPALLILLAFLLAAVMWYLDRMEDRNPTLQEITPVGVEEGVPKAPREANP
ncbi:hypothetical protein GF324_06190 [bacterium]|nr:hypothetical protein [bacterium]